MPRAHLPAPAQTHRQRRLRELSELPEFGGYAGLGAALGYDSGAYISQMCSGIRPVSEKLVQRIHTMRGGRYAGWFDAEQKAELSSVSLKIAALLDALGPVDSPEYLLAYRKIRDVLDESGSLAPRPISQPPDVATPAQPAATGKRAG